MDEAQTWSAPLDAFMQSTLAQMVIRPGSERGFHESMSTWIAGLDVDRIEGPLFQEYLDRALVDFIDAEVIAGRLQPLEETYAVGSIGSVWDELQHVTAAGLESRYVTEVEQGTREDMRASVLADTPRSITERVQALMQVIADYVRGRDVHEHGDELGR